MWQGAGSIFKVLSEKVTFEQRLCGEMKEDYSRKTGKHVSRPRGRNRLGLLKAEQEGSVTGVEGEGVRLVGPWGSSGGRLHTAVGPVGLILACCGKALQALSSSL